MPLIALSNYIFRNIMYGFNVSISISDKNIDNCKHLSDAHYSNLLCFHSIKTVSDLASSSKFSFVAASSAYQSDFCVNSSGFPTVKLLPDLSITESTDI